MFSFQPYHLRMQKSRLLRIEYHERLPTMKIAIRIIALSFVLAGVAAAATSKTATIVPQSHQSATASLPVPCGIYCR
jgi:hypothetical protein